MISFILCRRNVCRPNVFRPKVTASKKHFQGGEDQDDGGRHHGEAAGSLQHGRDHGQGTNDIKLFTDVIYKCVIMILHHRVLAKCQSIGRVERYGVPKVTSVFTLMLCESQSWELSFLLKLVWTSYNIPVSLCCVLGNVTSLSLSRNSSFKRGWELFTGVSTCLYDL